MRAIAQNLLSGSRDTAAHLPHWQTHRPGTPTPSRRPSSRLTLPQRSALHQAQLNRHFTLHPSVTPARYAVTVDQAGLVEYNLRNAGPRPKTRTDGNVSRVLSAREREPVRE